MLCIMNADSWTGKVREVPECPEQCSWRPQVRYYSLPVDGNWTEQVPSIILVGEEDGHGKARHWGCRTVETTWLTTHSHTHYPACQSVNKAQCHCSTSVTCSDPVPVSQPVGWLSFWRHYRPCMYGVDTVVTNFTQVPVPLKKNKLANCVVMLNSAIDPHASSSL